MLKMVLRMMVGEWEGRDGGIGPKFCNPVVHTVQIIVQFLSHKNDAVDR